MLSGHFYRRDIYFIELKSMKCQEHICHRALARPSLCHPSAASPRHNCSSNTDTTRRLCVTTIPERVSAMRKLRAWTLLFMHERTWRHVSFSLIRVSLMIHERKDTSDMIIIIWNPSRNLILRLRMRKAQKIATKTNAIDSFPFFPPFFLST